MRALIVEDDFVSRKILKEFLDPVAECDIAIDGKEAVCALDDPKTVFNAFFQGGATAYLVKPLRKEKIFEELRKFGLIR